MSNPKTPSATPPLWQRDTSPSDVLLTEDDSVKHPQSNRKPLVEQATKFLSEDGIRDAPADRKKSFLRSKGLNEREIDKLLLDPPAGTKDKSEEPQVLEQFLYPQKHMLSSVYSH